MLLENHLHDRPTTRRERKSALYVCENFQNKRGLKGCKWSSLNAQGIENPLSHPLLGLEEFPFSIIDPLG